MTDVTNMYEDTEKLGKVMFKIHDENRRGILPELCMANGKYIESFLKVSSNYVIIIFKDKTIRTNDEALDVINKFEHININDTTLWCIGIYEFVKLLSGDVIKNVEYLNNYCLDDWINPSEQNSIITNKCKIKKVLN